MERVVLRRNTERRRRSDAAERGLTVAVLVHLAPGFAGRPGAEAQRQGTLPPARPWLRLGLGFGLAAYGSGRRHDTVAASGMKAKD